MKKLNWLICVGVVVSVLYAVDVSAALYFFTGAVDDDMSVPANWEIGEIGWKVPGDGTAAAALFGTSDSLYIGGKTGEHKVGQGNPKGAIGPDTLTGTVYAGKSERVGPAIVGAGYSQPEDGILDVYGTLTASMLTLGQNGADTGNWTNGIANVYAGGRLDVGVTMTVGRYGWGRLNIFDGGLVTAGFTVMGLNNGQGGEINLEGGVLETNDLTIINPGGTNNATWTLTLKHGELRVSEDITARIQEYIAAGKILLSGDLGTGWYLVYDYNETNPGYTTVKVIRDPLQRFPYDESLVSQLTNQLQWELPDPNDPVTPSVVTCDVYFGTDPNILLNPRIVSKQAVESVPVALELGNVYYWLIDVYDSQISTTAPYYRSSVFTFNAAKVPPEVNAGGDVQTWLAGEPRVVQLNGAVSHFHGLPVVHAWTLLAEPDPSNPAVISDPAVLNPTVTLNAVGTYMLQLEGTDGELTAADPMQIIVYSDACGHASHQPGFEWRLHDVNRDCQVNMLDLAELAAQWFERNYSVE